MLWVFQKPQVKVLLIVFVLFFPSRSNSRTEEEEESEKSIICLFFSFSGAVHTAVVVCALNLSSTVNLINRAHLKMLTKVLPVWSRG